MENLNLNLPPFYEGQRIVALESHSQGAFHKGDEFVVLRLELQCCGWAVDIGKKSWINIIQCDFCGIRTHN